MPNESGCVAVVDDDPIMGESLQRALELEGWRAVWWHTGKTALDGMFELCPDLVLCDIRLPDMDGEEVFRTTNARSVAPPFIFMTAFGQIDQAVALVRAGAQDYLTKPFELSSLFQKVREASRTASWSERSVGLASALFGMTVAAAAPAAASSAAATRLTLGTSTNKAAPPPHKTNSGSISPSSKRQ